MIYFAFYFAAILIAIEIVRQDIADTYIHILPVLTLSCILFLAGIFDPMPMMDPYLSILSSLLASFLCLSVYAYTYFRKATGGLGGADILIIITGASLFGLYLFPVWMLFAATIGAALSFSNLKKVGIRSTSIDRKEVKALPFCLPLAVSGITLHLAEYFLPQHYKWLTPFL